MRLDKNPKTPFLVEKIEMVKNETSILRSTLCLLNCLWELNTRRMFVGMPIFNSDRNLAMVAPMRTNVHRNAANFGVDVTYTGHLML